jgi:saccharopine dehydrogenase-like NADP-dependent oxidoreductase
MARVTVLGAGLVTGPLVRHLLSHSTHAVTVAARSPEAARRLVGDHPRGAVAPLDVTDLGALSRLVEDSAVVVSMLPYVHHVTVAKLCLEHRRHLVTTSYVSPAMRALDATARERGVVLLNELGLDPGIDHMSAMRVIHRVRAAGGRVVSFRSYCGGLPAPEANNNPWGYKFSWSPRGVVLAARNAAIYLHQGQEVQVPGPELFASPERVEVGGMVFEGYPNRNALDYLKVYDLEGVHTMFRGTLRNVGHCRTWKALADLGLLDDAPRAWRGSTTASALLELAGHPAGDGDAHAAVASRLGFPADSDPLYRMAWLGLFDGAALPSPDVSPLDLLVSCMVPRLRYAPGERDMIVLRHEFIAAYPDRREALGSTFIDHGEPGGDTAMSRTVGLPAAIGVLKVLDGSLATPGVVVPVSPAVYDPILDELERLGVGFREERRPL